MKITKTNLTDLIRDELENFKIVKLSKDDMEQLHKTGQIEKDGVFYQYQEPVKEDFKIRKTDKLMNPVAKKSFSINAEKEDEIEEKLKMSKGSGRGTSWMNYDDDTYRMQVTKDSNQYHISVFKKFMGPSSKRLLDLRGISKTDAAKLVKLAKSTGLEKTAKYGKSKYKKYVSEGKLTEDFKNNEWEVYVADENRREKIVKVAKSKRAAVILYNKLIKTDKYHEVGMRVIKEGKLKEGKKITLGDKGRKFTLDIENEAQMFLARLKKDNKKITTKNISNYIDAEYKFFNTPKLNQQVFNYMKKNLKSLSEVVNHTMARFLYIPKKDIKKAIKVVKSMPMKLKGKVEVDKKPADKVKGHYRITTEKQLFNAVVEFLATADIGVKTISKGKM